MGDDTVDALVYALQRVAEANGVSNGQLRPIADAVVNCLRTGGQDELLAMDDEEIKKVFGDSDASATAA